MKKRFRDTDLFKWILTLIEIGVIVAVVIGIITLLNSFGIAEDVPTEEAYVLCMPGDYVNIRPNPNKKGEAIGYAECGYRLSLDGKEKNGYLHCVDLSLEMTEGWIHKGYVAYDEPEYVNRKATVVSIGRLAVRKYIGGKRTRWLQPMATVRVYYWTDEWCVTNCGYVQSDYLELDGE